MIKPLLLLLLRLYRYLSPLKMLLPAPPVGGCCRFHPTCSGYAREAIEIHGAGRGSALALRRLSRCRPFGAHGVDLVPPTKQARSTAR